MTAATTEKATGGTGPSGQSPDPRVVELVRAMLPMPEDQAGKDEESKLAEGISKQLEEAQKRAAEKVKKPNEADLKDAEAKFFQGDVAGAEARKKAEEEQKKAEADLAKAYQAAGAGGPVVGSSHRGT